MSRRVLWLDPLKGLMLFGLLGPTLAAWTILLVAGGAFDGLETLASGLFLFGVFGVLFGGIPAAATGIAAGVLKSHGRLHTQRHCFVVAVLGSAFSALYGWWTQEGANAASWAVFLAVLGFAPAFLCALIFRSRPARTAA